VRRQSEAATALGCDSGVLSDRIHPKTRRRLRLDSQTQERVKKRVEGNLANLGDSLDLGKPTSRQRRRPPVFMRFAAGIWFAIVFGALAMGFYSYLEDLRKFSFWNFSNLILSPALVGGLSGYILGGAIVAASDVYPGLFAALRGMAIGLICISFQVVNLAFFGTLFGQVRRETLCNSCGWCFI